MGKTLEQTVHEMELPRPGAEGEDFTSYISRVAHAAAFVGAAWAITNGPQVQVPPREVQPQPEYHTHPAEQDEPQDEGAWDEQCDGPRTEEGRFYDAVTEYLHQDTPEHIVKEH